MRIHRLIALETLWRLGWPGLAGGLTLVFAAAWSALVLLPGLEARELAQDRARRAEARLAAAERGEVVVAPSPDRDLQAFRAALPGQPEATGDIDRLYAAADAEGLSLARGEYGLVVEPGNGLARYQILLPVRGAYPQLRRFLARALETVPALGLEDLDLQRAQASETLLEARFRMTLYLARP